MKTCKEQQTYLEEFSDKCFSRGRKCYINQLSEKELQVINEAFQMIPESERNPYLTEKHERKYKKIAQNYFDYAPEYNKKKKKATIKYLKEARQCYPAGSDNACMDELYVAKSSDVQQGGYNAIDRFREITAAASIWILDQLTLQDDLNKAYKYLPELSDDEFLIPSMLHPIYPLELIQRMAKLLLNRNKDLKKPNGVYGTLVADTLSNKKIQSKSRLDFEAVIALLDKKDVEKTIEKYKEKIWDFYKIYFVLQYTIKRKKEHYISEYNACKEKCCNIEKNAYPVTTDNVADLFYPKNYVKKNDFDFYKGIKEKEYNDANDLKHMNCIESLKLEGKEELLANFSFEDEEKLQIEKEYRNEVPDEILNEFLGFTVDDPYDYAFALFYMLDTGSDIPWIYFGSLAVANCALSELPISATPFPDYMECDELSDCNKLLYKLKFDGTKKHDIKSKKYKSAKNLSRILFENFFTVFPRIVCRSDLLNDFIKSFGNISEDAKEAYSLLYIAVGSTSILKANFEEDYYKSNDEKLDEIVVEKENPEELHSIITKQNKKIKELETALSEEKAEKKKLKEQLANIVPETEELKQEIYDLRELVFNTTNDLQESESEISKTEFPYHTSDKIVSFGGYISWYNKMKELLPDVKFVSVDTMPNVELIQNADEIWIQTNKLSHAFFYRIINIVREYNKKIRYYSFSSPEKCAEEIIKSKNK